MPTIDFEVREIELLLLSFSDDGITCGACSYVAYCKGFSYQELSTFKGDLPCESLVKRLQGLLKE